MTASYGAVEGDAHFDNESLESPTVENSSTQVFGARKLSFLFAGVALVMIGVIGMSFSNRFLGDQISTTTISQTMSDILSLKKIIGKHDKHSDEGEDEVEDIDNDDNSFTIFSSSFDYAGSLNINYTCTALGVSSGGNSPPLSWKNVPEGTVEFVLLMTSNYYDDNGGGLKYDWGLYNIPSTLTELPAGVSSEKSYCNTDYGLCSGTTPEKPQYYYKAPCSDGAGARNYTFDVYALGEPVLNHVNYTLVSVDLHSWAPDGVSATDDGGR